MKIGCGKVILSPIYAVFARFSGLKNDCAPSCGRRLFDVKPLPHFPLIVVARLGPLAPVANFHPDRSEGPI